MSSPLSLRQVWKDISPLWKTMLLSVMGAVGFLGWWLNSQPASFSRHAGELQKIVGFMEHYLHNRNVPFSKFLADLRMQSSRAGRLRVLRVALGQQLQLANQVTPQEKQFLQQFAQPRQTRRRSSSRSAWRNKVNSYKNKLRRPVIRKPTLPRIPVRLP